MRFVHLFFLPERLSNLAGPFQFMSGVTSLPACPSIGQNLPERQREQFSRGGISTTFRRRPYFLLGMAGASRVGADEPNGSVFCLSKHHLNDKPSL